MAQQLLGKQLVRQLPGGLRISGEIAETEAYLGLEDPACHSFSGKITPRTSTLYLPAGHSYVYFVYGMHHCFNVVCGDQSQPEAVLIRALRITEGWEQILASRGHEPLSPRQRETVASGPAKLCRALSIDLSLNRLDLTTSEQIFIEEPRGAEALPKPGLGPLGFMALPRVGIDYAGDAALWPLRFVLA